MGRCFCFELECGVRLIGFLHTGCALAVMIYTAFLAADAKAQIGTFDDMDGTYTSVYKHACFFAALGSVHVVLGIVLLVGAFWRKTRLVLAWVVLMTVLYVVAILFAIIVTILYAPNKSTSDLLMGFWQGTAFFLLEGYLILCVRSYYLKLKSEEDMCGPQDN